MFPSSGPGWPRERCYTVFGQGLLGKNGSPACGVTRTWLDNRQQDGQGAFIRELKNRLAAEKLDVPVFGVADRQQDQAIAWLEARLRAAEKGQEK